MAIYLRISDVRKRAGLNAKEFASSLGIDNSQYGKIEKGENNLTLEKTILLCSIYNVSSDWLLFGRGDMELGAKVSNSIQGNGDKSVNIIGDHSGNHSCEGLTKEHMILIMEERFKFLQEKDKQLREKDVQIKTLLKENSKLNSETRDLTNRVKELTDKLINRK